MMTTMMMMDMVLVLVISGKFVTDWVEWQTVTVQQIWGWLCHYIFLCWSVRMTSRRIMPYHFQSPTCSSINLWCVYTCSSVCSSFSSALHELTASEFIFLHLTLWFPPIWTDFLCILAEYLLPAPVMIGDLHALIVFTTASGYGHSEIGWFHAAAVLWWID